MTDKKEQKEIIMKEFGERLNKLFRENNIQQKALAISLEVRATTVSNWVNGKSEPTLTNLFEIMSFFQTECPNTEILKELFPEIYKTDKILLTEKRKEQLNATIEVLTKIRDRL